MKYGFFVHYVWAGACGSLTRDQDGQPPKNLDDLADSFDVTRFVNDLAVWQVEYIVFTAWHANINPLFPCETMKKWGLTNHYCQRDLIGEIIKACNASGIKVLLYTHPRDGHDLTAEEQVKTGWVGTEGNDPDWKKFNYQKWNDFNNDLYGELVNRYGNQIIGLYLDEGSVRGDSYRVVDYERLKQTIKRQHPDLVMVQNYYGNLYSCDVGDAEYHHWREFANTNGGVWPANRMAVGTCFAPTWWASQPAGTNLVEFSPEDIFRYTVLQAGVNTEGGGVQWASGPYAGGGWETGVDETMRKVAALIQPIAASVKNVYASQAFPTQNGAALHPTAWGAYPVAWGVATDAADGSATYIHVLIPPNDKTIRLGMPANGVRFESAKVLADGEPVGLSCDAAGYVITLPENRPWDKLDTVIRLQVSKNK